MQKKLIFWEFFPNGGPHPLSPFWEFRNFFTVFFCQVGNFWVILRCVKGVIRAMVITQKYWELG
jgi:hypothetical protein